jgi:hypothetical protein
MSASLIEDEGARTSEAELRIRLACRDLGRAGVGHRSRFLSSRAVAWTRTCQSGPRSPIESKSASTRTMTSVFGRSPSRRCWAMPRSFAATIEPSSRSWRRSAVAPIGCRRTTRGAGSATVGSPGAPATEASGAPFADCPSSTGSPPGDGCQRTRAGSRSSRSGAGGTCYFASPSPPERQDTSERLSTRSGRRGRRQLPRNCSGHTPS